MLEFRLIFLQLILEELSSLLRLDFFGHFFFLISELLDNSVFLNPVDSTGDSR